MRYSCALLMVLSLLAGCNRLQSPQLVVAAKQGGAEQPVAIPGEVVGDFVIGEPLNYGKLTVFPISSRTAKTADRFMTLDEGLASGKVEICEVGSAAEAEEETSAADAIAAADPFGPDNAVPAADDPFAEPPREVDAPDTDDPFGNNAVRETPAVAVAPEDDPFGEDQPEDAPITMVRDLDDPFGDLPAVDSTQQNSEDGVTADMEELTGIISATVHPSDFEGEGDDVNRLMFINHSDRPLYLMPGELIIGGNQDRTIARETIVPPGGKRVAVEVFCVEHGRWHQHTVEELQETVVAAQGGMSSDSALAVSVSPDFVEASGNSAQERARLQSVDLKSRGKFVASLGSVSSGARRAVQEANDQSAVWEQVAQENLRSGTETETGAFTANYLDQETIQALAPYMKELGSTVADRPQVVGVLVAVGGEIKTVDVFESTPLFQKMWPKLLKSFAFDALHAEELAGEEAGEEGVEKIAVAKSDLPTMADARHCLELATRAEVQEVKTADGLTMTRRQANEMVSFSVHDEESAALMGGKGGGFGAAMHGGGFF